MARESGGCNGLGAAVTIGDVGTDDLEHHIKPETHEAQNNSLGRIGSNGA